jgi:hypothetical protein
MSSTVAISSEKTRQRPADFSMRIVEFFLEFLCQMYMRIEEFQYHQDEVQSNILIADKFADVLDHLGKKPAIITDLKSIVKQNIGLDDRGGFRHPQFGLGKQYRTAMYNASLIIYAVSGNQWQSRRLAFMTGMGITGFEPEIRKNGKFIDVNVPVPVGEPVKLVTGARGKVWSTPVTVQVSFEETWVRSIIQEELLDKFILDIRLGGTSVGSGC